MKKIIGVSSKVMYVITFMISINVMMTKVFTSLGLYSFLLASLLGLLSEILSDDKNKLLMVFYSLSTLLACLVIWLIWKFAIVATVI